MTPVPQQALAPNSTVVLGMTIMAAAMLLAPGMDIIAKYLGTHEAVGAALITFCRFLIQAVVLLVLLIGLTALGYKARIMPNNLYGNMLRGAMMGFAAFLFFIAVTFMPVADAISVFFVAPFIVTILSAILLGEDVGWRRRVAVLFGFAGALIVIQPSFEEVGFATLLPVGTAFIYSLYLILTRKIASGDDEPLAMQCAAGIGGVLMMGALLILGATILPLSSLSPALPQTELAWSLILMLGLIGTVAHLMIVIACQKAPASILAPFQYLEIIGATVLGLLVFGDFPTPVKWIGIAIIIGSGFYIFLRERHLSKA
ncbi:MAG: DMT family transporter [Pseudomonadota bacterium]